MIDGPADAEIVVCGRDGIDEAAALYPEAELLCEPSATEAVLGLMLALRRAPSSLADPARNREAERLRALATDAARIARALEQLSEEAGGQGLADRQRGYRGPSAPEPTAEQVRAAIRARRLRERFFAAELFADPAWDMLLDLMAARLDGEGVAVSSLCIAANVPPTTALRWIKALTDQGMFVRQPDPSDRRRVFIALSEEAAQGMAGWFAAIGEA